MTWEPSNRFTWPRFIGLSGTSHGECKSRRELLVASLCNGYDPGLHPDAHPEPDMLRRISPIVALLPLLTTGCNRAPAPPVVATDSSNPAAAVIRATLIDGQSAEAGRLAGAALLAFGDSASARLFVSLKRQADTLETIGQNAAVRVARFKKEAEEARATGNLRMAVLALEEAVALSNDADIKQHYEQLNLRVRRYDEALLRAADLRRDPNRLEN